MRVEEAGPGGGRWFGQEGPLRNLGVSIHLRGMERVRCSWGLGWYKHPSGSVHRVSKSAEAQAEPCRRAWAGMPHVGPSACRDPGRSQGDPPAGPG